MNLNQFYYFSELVKCHQFSKAAKNLHISQPSLSNSIKTLENELGCELIERKNGRIELTKYGHIFLEATESTISILEKTKRDIIQTKQNETNTIEIGCIPTAAETFVPYFISKLEKVSPIPVHYIYHTAISPQICHDIQNGNYNVGICAKVEGYPDLTFIPLYIENTTIIPKNKAIFSSKSPKNTREIYLVYNSKIKISETAKSLIDIIAD